MPRAVHFWTARFALRPSAQLSSNLPIAHYSMSLSSRSCVSLHMEAENLASNNQKNESEILFERYLNENVCTDWDFEPEFEGKSKRPDYRVPWHSQSLLFEVKELHTSKPVPNGATFIDPYHATRKKIEAARKKFKEFEEFICSVVIYNIDNWEVRLNPRDIFSAMLGDLGIAIGFDERAGVLIPNTEQNVYLERGKMWNRNAERAQNTKISSIIVLVKEHIANPDFNANLEAEIARRGSQVGRPATIEEQLGIRMRLYSQLGNTHHEILRVIVCENPFAQRLLPDDVFRGPYDERWIQNECTLQCVYRGPRVNQLHNSSGIDDTNDI